MKNDYLESRVINELYECSISSIVFLWSDSNETFWRSTGHKERSTEESKVFFPTVSLRCSEALIDTFLAYPNWISKGTKDILFDKIIPRLLEIEFDDLNSSINTEQEEGELNEFTLSLFIQTFCKLHKLLSLEFSSKKLKKLVEKIEKSLDALLSGSWAKPNHKQGLINEHPFILFHVNRAINLSLGCIQSEEVKSKAYILNKEINDCIRLVSERLLSKNELNLLTPSDSVALAFCCACLADTNIHENKQHIISTLNISMRSQDSSGAWPLGRVVNRNKDIGYPLLEISTYEIAYTLTKTLFSLLKEDIVKFDSKAVKENYKHLLRSINHISQSRIEINSKASKLVGWCSDQPYNYPLIESWTSANVLSLALSFNQFDEEVKKLLVLKSFPTISPSQNGWPQWLKWNAYLNDSETDHDNPILKYLNDKIVQPISDNPQNLPSADNRTVSALLFGPPGTSKTTIVKGVAEGLNWPVVMLNPGHFIEGGLESIERLSQSVFDRLMKLSRVVVLFDECDELFRDRSPKKDSEQTRGITAFITACMLPKLQELHDNGKVVFFICTNNFDTIDSAIKRGGRIDHIIAVGPPDKIARKKIIEFASKSLRKKMPTLWNDALEKLAEKTDGFIRSEVIRCTEALLNTSPWKSKAEVGKSVVGVIKSFKDSLTITPEELSSFKVQAPKFSNPIYENQ